MSTVSTTNTECGSVVFYATPSETGLEGPDQVLKADVNSVWEADGRVRIKIDQSKRNDFEPISIPGLLMKTAKKYPDHPALVSRPGIDGSRTTLTYREYEKQVRTVAKAFLNLGLERYHSVCILGFNSPQWVISFIAAIYAGGFASGIYTTNSPEACQYCAEYSRANIIVVDDEKQLNKILKIKKNLPNLKTIIQYDGIPSGKNALSWNEVIEIGEKEPDKKLSALLKTIGVNECCTVILTSGTVDNPKIVMLSHDNILSNLKAFSKIDEINQEAQETFVSYLPLSHVAAQYLDICLSMMIAGTTYFADKNALKGSLLDTLKVARPTAFFGVPRVWEKIYEKIQIIARNNGTIKQWIADWAKAQGLHHNLERMNGNRISASWGYIFAKWLVYGKVKAALGLERCRSFFTGSAPLSDDIKRYFMSLDIVMYDAYGLSESSAVHSTCTKIGFQLGSVGRTLPSFSTKLHGVDTTGEGEICLGGRHVFMGYLGDPEKTREAKDKDGWLHSGDLGRIDANGFLYVTGRIKELVITAGGENIPPVRIEQILVNECPGLSNAMLIGDRKKYLTILVTLKTEMSSETGEPLDPLTPEVLEWAESLGSKARTLSEILETQDSFIYQAIQKAIDRTNEKAISNAQRVQKFKILPRDFSVSTGELGPTMKLKRNFVANKYADLIEEMYKE